MISSLRYRFDRAPRRALLLTREQVLVVQLLHASSYIAVIDLADVAQRYIQPTGLLTDA